MKRYMLMLSLLCIPTVAKAGDAPTVTLGGHTDIMAGYVKQKDIYQRVDSNINNGKLHESSIVNDTRIKVSADGKLENGMGYGGFFQLYADTAANADGRPSSTVGEKLGAYLEGGFGKLEAGGVKSTAHEMHFNGATVARGAGGVDGEAVKWFASKTTDGFNYGDRFIAFPGLPSFCDCKASANKISYYTPKFDGLQFGISYTPDVQFFGTAARTHAVSKETGDQFRKITAFSAAYEGKVNDDLSYGVSLIGEVGKAKDSTVDRKDLKAYEVGAKLGYKDFSIAGSYADWLGTGEPVSQNVDAKYGSHHWTAGVAYEKESWGASVTYMNAKRANSYVNGVPASTTQHDLSHNQLRELSFGVDCKPAEGIKSYVEYTIFDFDRDATSVNNRGEVLLVGTKISF